MRNKYWMICILVSFTTLLHAQKKEKIKGNKEVVTVFGALSNSINTVVVHDNIELNIAAGKEDAYFLNTDKNLVSSVLFTVSDSTLTIYTLRNIVKSKKLEVSLTTTQLENIILYDKVKLATNKKFNGKTLSVTGYNKSEIDLDVEADAVHLAMYEEAEGSINIEAVNSSILMKDKTELTSNAKIENIKITLSDRAELQIKGDCKQGDFKVQKRTLLNAKKLKCASLALATSDRADANVHAVKNLQVNAQGKSEVKVYGNPTITMKGLTDRSSIIKK